MIMTDEKRHRQILHNIAHRAMLERGLLPDFSPEVLTELNRIPSPATADGQTVRDLRTLPWASIDNDDSRDLDQLTVAEEMPAGAVKILVAVADVDALVKKGSAINDHAQHNTTSVYTAATIFPMLPERLSTDFTSLNYQEDRLAIVIEMIISEDGSLQGSDVYRAVVHNQAKLAYNSVAAWLENSGPRPERIATIDGLDQNLRLQDKAARSLKALRHLNGALNFQTIETIDYLPSNAVLPPNYKAPEAPEVIDGKAEVKSYKKGSNYQTGEINVDSDVAKIRLPIFDFPGMKVAVDNLPASFNHDDCSNQDFCFGQISFNLNKGSHQIIVKLEKTIPRQIGDILSLLTLVSVIIVFFSKKKYLL